MNYYIKTSILGLQTLLACFGATVLVGLLVGISPSLCLFSAGIGTLVFHFITKGKVPAFLGSSFAFITPMIMVASYHTDNPYAYVAGGVLVAGLVHVAFSFIVKKIGIEKVAKVITPVVAGTVIMIIGLMLAPVAINMASSNWTLAVITLAAAGIAKMYFKGFLNLIPILVGIIVGYIVGAITGNVSVEVTQAFAAPPFVLPQFSWYALSVIVPAAIAPAIEHIGDIYAMSNLTGIKYEKDPGLHKTLLGDGIATSVAGLFGGVPNTTYSENTGVLAMTGNYSPVIPRIAAIFAIILSFIPAVGAVISSIPVGVLGGISILLFGMIASVGAKTWVTNKVDFNPKNTIIVAVMLVLGLGGASIQAGEFVLQGLALAAVVGIGLELLWHRR